MLVYDPPLHTCLFAVLGCRKLHTVEQCIGGNVLRASWRNGSIGRRTLR